MKRQVLLVDDNQQILEELQEVLTDHHIDVHKAETGQQALELAAKGHYDVGIVDIRLPDFDGIELIDLLKEKQPQTIYLIITAYSSTETAIKSLQKGILDYVVKPFHPEQLVHSIKKGFLLKDSLEAKDDRLEELVKEKGLLQAKVMMLEQLNEIFLDREKKIMELKAEVNNLCLKLKQSPKYKI